MTLQEIAEQWVRGREIDLLVTRSTAQALEHCLSNPVTNGWLIRHGHVPCEANPRTGGLSRTVDPAHALAEVTVGGKGFESRHLCRGCAKEFYPYRTVKEGVIWS